MTREEKFVAALLVVGPPPGEANTLAEWDDWWTKARVLLDADNPPGQVSETVKFYSWCTGRSLWVHRWGQGHD